jgi:hypothetical protein
MFIYFPEFLYRKTKEFTKNTFKPKIDKNEISVQIQNTLNTGDFQKMLKVIKDNKIRLPTIDYKHCIKFDSLKPTSNYDQIDNKITMCSNLIDNTDEIFRKEFTYFYETNITLAGKEKNTDNLSKMAISVCKNSILESNQHIKSELIRRCAYYELKHRFLQEDPKKYIEHNYFN